MRCIHPLVQQALLLSCLGAGCGGPPVTLAGKGGYTLEFDPSSGKAGVVSLMVGERKLLWIPIDAGIQLGVVPALEETRSYDPYWLENGEDLLPLPPDDGLTWHKVKSAHVALDEAGALDTLQVHLSFDGIANTGILRFQAESTQLDQTTRFRADFSPPSLTEGAIAYLRVGARSTGDAKREGFYGLGEWPDEVNHRGKARPMQMEFDATESANNENHVPVPLLVSTEGWGLFVENERVGVFDVARKEEDLIEVTYGTGEASSKGLRFHLFGATTPLDIPALYYEVTGQPILPAPWALGPWIWRDENRNQDEVESDIATIRSKDLATSGLWIDRPYASFVNTFDFHKTQFLDPKKMLRFAQAQGLRMALWSTPYLEQGAQPQRSKALQEGYFPKKSGLPLNKWSDPIDFTNPAAYAFWQEQIGKYRKMDPGDENLGFEGFKLDYAEDIVPGLGMGRNVWRFFDGSDERTMHHRYTLLYHKVYAETLPQAGGYLLCRAGRFGDQRYVSVIWPGDMDATMTRYKERFVPRGGTKEVIGVGGLPATVAQGVNLAASGFPFYAADTGGYRHSPPNKEVFVRWFQQTALSAVMNVGDSSSQPPWVYTKENERDDQVLDLYRVFARLHLRLFPYEWTYAQKLPRGGRPLIRALGLAYPELGQHPADTYLFGEDLLVAPVVDAGKDRRKVLLPKGRWVSYWDSTSYDGPTEVVVEAPLLAEKGLPLFLKEGAIVPLLRPDMDTLAPASDPQVQSLVNRPGPLFVRVVPLGSAGTKRFVVYDGTEILAGEGKIEVRAGAVFRQGVVIERLRTAEPKEVFSAGKALAKKSSLEALLVEGEGYFHSKPGNTQGNEGTLWIASAKGAEADHGEKTWK